MALVHTSEAQISGVPLGSSVFVRGHVAGKLLKTSTEAMAKLVQFDDAQAAMYLLRLSYGIGLANHYMRTTPFSQWEAVAAKFALCIRDAVAQLLGTTFPREFYAQACISTQFGGLGIPRVADHADVAFAASWHESITLCEAEYVPQMIASAKVDAESLDELISHASIRDAQRLRRNDFAHANAWISAAFGHGRKRHNYGAPSLPHCRPPLDRPSCYFCSCLLPSLSANHGYLRGPRRVQEVR